MLEATQSCSFKVRCLLQGIPLETTNMKQHVVKQHRTEEHLTCFCGETFKAINWLNRSKYVTQHDEISDESLSNASSDHLQY